jgi:Tol biopolymer transport system component
VDVPAPGARIPGFAISALLVLLLAAPGCSKKQTSSASLCDNEGTDLIAFSSDRGHQGQYDLYLYDADLGGYRALRNLNSATVSDASPALSSDGQLVAFVSARGGTGDDLYLYERISCSLLSTPGLNTSGDETDPAFTGNTLRLAFVRDTSGHRRIRLATAGLLTFVPLPGLDSLAAPYDDWAPSPDRTGDNIAFVSNREGTPHVYLYSRTNQSVDSLTALRAAGGSDLEPALTSDDHYLAFASDRAGGRGGFDIYLFDLTARSFVSLAGLNSAFDERHPSLSAAAAFVAFQSDSSPARTWVVRYYERSSKLFGTISRQDTTANDVSPSLRFP